MTSPIIDDPTAFFPSYDVISPYGRHAQVCLRPVDVRQAVDGMLPVRLGTASSPEFNSWWYRSLDWLLVVIEWPAGSSHLVGHPLTAPQVAGETVASRAAVRLRAPTKEPEGVMEDYERLIRALIKVDPDLTTLHLPWADLVRWARQGSRILTPTSKGVARG